MKKLNITGPKFSNLNALFVIGCMESIWAPMIPYVKNAFQLDESQLGMTLLCTGLGSVLVIPFAGTLCKRFGVKPLVYLFTIILAMTLIFVSLNIALWLTALMLITFGISMGVIDVSSNVNAVTLEKRYQRPLMSGFHGGYSVGTLLGAASMTMLLTFDIGVFPATLSLITIYTLYAVFGCQQLLKKEDLTDVTASEGAVDDTKKKFKIPPLVIVVGALCFIMYASEGAVMSWSSVYANQELGVDIRYAGYIYTAFAVMMTILRLTGNKLVEKLGTAQIVVAGAGLVTIGFGLVAFVENVYGCVIGFALVGIGAANIVPQLVSYAGRIKGMPVQNIISFVNIFGYTGILLGPAIIGFVTKKFGFMTTFAGISSFCAIVMIVCYFLKMNRKG